MAARQRLSRPSPSSTSSSRTSSSRTPSNRTSSNRPSPAGTAAKSEPAAPSFRDRWPASENASRAARGASRKVGTQPELQLRRALWAAGLRYQKNAPALPGKPDLIFPRARLAIFCDGDFWHGRDWTRRKPKLGAGNNPSYWVAKIERNMQRDRLNTIKLERAGWVVLRFWEREIEKELPSCVQRVQAAIAEAEREAADDL